MRSAIASEERTEVCNRPLALDFLPERSRALDEDPLT